MATKQVSDKAFDTAIKLIAKKFGNGYCTKGEEDGHPQAIPTGHEDLDCLTTKGASGIYLGGIVELMGSEGSGKSSLALRTAGNAQKLGHRCCWIDAEAAFDPNIAILNGCDPTKLIMPDLSDTRAMDTESSVSFFNSTEIMEMIYKSVISNVFGLIVLDSVAGLMPESVLQDDFDPNKNAQPAEVARVMSRMLGKIAQACKKTQTTVIFINQLRDKPGEMYPDRFHTPGGRALKFFCHQRFSVEKIKGKDGRVVSSEDGKEEIIGHYARITIVKNKKAPPVPENVSIQVPIYYRKYDPDAAKRCYDIARGLKVVTIRNGVLTWKDEDNNVILTEDGEAVFLNSLRDKKLEARLAADCVKFEKDERNTSLKVPVKVPQSVVDLAKTVGVTKVEETKKTSKVKQPALDLS